MRKVTSAAESGTIAIVFGAESTSGKGSSQGNASCAHLRALSMSLPLLLPEGWPTVRGSTPGDFEFRRREKDGQCEHTRFGRQARSEIMVKAYNGGEEVQLVADQSAVAVITSGNRCIALGCQNHACLPCRLSYPGGENAWPERQRGGLYVPNTPRGFRQRSPKIDTSGACFFCKSCSTPQPSREKLS